MSRIERVANESRLDWTSLWPSAAPLPAYRRIVVPDDGSSGGASAIPTAVALARSFEADVHTVTVQDGAIERDIAEQAFVAGDRPTDLPDGDRQVVLYGSDVVGQVLGYAEAPGGPSLLCIATRSRGRLGRKLFGSVAAELISRRKPLVVVGPVAERPGWKPASRTWPPPLSADQIAVLVDGTATSEVALPWAAAWARALGKELAIFAVVEDAPSPIRPNSTASRFAPYGDAESYLNVLARRWRCDGLSVVTAVQRDPIGVASGVRSYLTNHETALLVIPSGLRTKLESSRRSTDSFSIVRAATVPCLVVPGAPSTRKFREKRHITRPDDELAA